MPFHDAEPFIGDAVRSIRFQSYENWELIAVDDGSSDASAAVVRELSARDARVRLVGVPRGGGARARNAGVALAAGHLIAQMDADDVALPDRLAVQLEWMRTTGVEVCGGWVQRFGDRDGLLWFPEAHDDVRRELLFRNGLMHPTVMGRAEIIRANPYEDVPGEDYELWTRLARRHRVGNVPAVVLKYRCHARQTHIVEAAACRIAHRKARRRFLTAEFPTADSADAVVFDRIAEAEPFPTLDELACAGEWLARLAGESADQLLRRRMLQRWRHCCRRSAPLGLAVYRAYTRFAARFEVPQERADRRLLAACALRLDARAAA